jgi:hypothetical protein
LNSNKKITLQSCPTSKSTFMMPQNFLYSWYKKTSHHLHQLSRFDILLGGFCMTVWEISANNTEEVHKWWLFSLEMTFTLSKSHLILSYVTKCSQDSKQMIKTIKSQLISSAPLTMPREFEQNIHIVRRHFRTTPKFSFIVWGYRTLIYCIFLNMIWGNKLNPALYSYRKLQKCQMKAFILCQHDCFSINNFIISFSI